MSDLIDETKKGKFLSLDSDGLIAEARNPHVQNHTVIEIDGKKWTVISWSPMNETYTLKNGELLQKVTAKWLESQ